MIVVSSIVKKYGNKIALDNVSLEVKKGEFVSLIGPNGAGKTTLIRILLTLMKPDKGEVQILGENPFRNKRIFKAIGYVQEIPNYPPFLTGRQVLELSAKIRGVDKSEVKRVLEFVEMENYANNPIIKYSKGMVQRIAIAESLLGNPSILIMDEPNMGIDPIFSLKTRELLNKLKRKDNVSILMTSHELEDVKKLSDRIFMIYKGKIVFSGTVEDMIKEFLGIQVIVETDEIENAEEALKGIEYVKGVFNDGNRLIVKLNEDRREDLLRDLVTSGVKVKGFYIDLNLEEAYMRALRNV
ncbi:ABC transporter ATP-binding protein [Saccharolobus islandicus]|uniref:ABC-type multidrug transport system, ATPase component n=5 Tax=Saccharolobus islandicus TaxID=43080 RepID=M9U8A5_SACIS|nr:ABC transporter ATP-binding protein [Sulfolobus islandicus]ACP54932.1 ABC transporter related [Sulfolobus islandicus M.16.27]ACR41557.1 ABC transporter related [Sulfolobus islandicus M.16.4]ADX81870.1 ABC transporter related protein [Sulfolobus islandicus HVE10/4]ADX84880.1 ABC transporter related protein [Sulfolobus islandicus REY15A]AGJ62352.1 ABC-type multidrug transport system, ATPase component [Sulfolobus islandicus LAL14/1]